MGWTLHSHYWRRKAEALVTPEGKDLPGSGLILEACICGAIRQIEYCKGTAPVVFITPAPTD